MDFLQDEYFWFTLSFLVFLFGAWKMGKSKVIALLDERIEDIRNKISSAENLRVESQELLAQYQRKHKDAVKDAEAIVEKAERQAEEIRRKAEAESDETIARREKQLEERLDRMKAAAVEEIRQRAAELAIAATSELIAEQLDKKTSDKLVDEAIKGISKNLH